MLGQRPLGLAFQVGLCGFKRHFNVVARPNTASFCVLGVWLRPHCQQLCVQILGRFRGLLPVLLHGESPQGPAETERWGEWMASPHFHCSDQFIFA